MRLNLANGWNGYAVQNRYFSSPLDDTHAWMCNKYIEENPVRAGIVKKRGDYRWSSAYTRARDIPDILIDYENPWYKRLVLSQENSNENCRLSKEQVKRFQMLSSRNLPIGSEDYIRQLEKETGKVLRLRRRGRPTRN